MRAAAEQKLLIHDAVAAADYVDADRKKWRRRQMRIAGL